MLWMFSMTRVFLTLRQSSKLENSSVYLYFHGTTYGCRSSHQSMWNRSALSIGALDVRYRDTHMTPHELECTMRPQSWGSFDLVDPSPLMKFSFITKATRQDVKEIGITFEQNQAHNFLLSIPTCVNLRHQAPAGSVTNQHEL